MRGVDRLLAAYPERFTGASAAAWLSERRALLVARTSPPSVGLSVSSGCAANGARTHAAVLAASAAHALARLDAGLGTACEACGDTLPFDRLDSAPAAVRCTGCTPASIADTRWCR